MDYRIRLYLDYLTMKRQASAYVSANDERIVGNAMFRLNHAAYHSTFGSHKTPIYTLKNQLVKLWYQRGLATRVLMQTQTQLCWRCEGSGEDPYEYHREVADGVFEDWCLKCQGSGIWRQHTLYAFDFVVNGKQFSWHQPASLIDYAVTPTADEITEYERRDASDEVVFVGTPEGADLDYCIVLQYLKQQGVPRSDLHELMTFRQLAKVLWHSSKWYWRWRDLRTWWRIHTTRRGDTIDIPF